MAKITKSEVQEILEKDNYRFAKILLNNGISKLNMICCGNSISSGYSMSTITRPLLLRNENIKNILANNSINLNRYHFARAKDNNDEHIFSWLINDIPLSYICRQNRVDVDSMNCMGIDDTNVDEIYPLNDNVTIKELLSSTDSSNIIIYNGATGSFLDNITRGGRHKFTYGVKRDCISIEAFLKYIQEYNRNNNKNIQVYLCGTPSLLQTSDIFINTRLKSISNKYANVTYVPNIPKTLIYKKDNGGFTLDLHYNELEYLIFNDKIIKTINENYLLNQLLIALDRRLYNLNKDYQSGYIDNNDIYEKANIAISGILKEYESKLENENMDLKYVLNCINKYIIERTPYDFNYIGQKNIKRLIKKY